MPADSSTPQPSIRPARAGDLAALLSLYELLADAEPAAVPAEPDAAAPILAGALADESRHLVVAEVDGEVCATADMVVVTDLRHSGSPWAIVENVVVAADRRRRGIATRMMGHLIEIAREHGCYKVQLLSGKQRTGAHAMYRHVGMEAVAEGFKLYLEE